MSFFTALISSKIALGALGVAVVAAGGTAAVEVAGNLPEAAHGIVQTASPTPTPIESADAADSATTATATAVATATATATATPVGPDATGPAAFGLCTAFTHGGLATTSIAYGSLVTAASGAANIAAYCDTVVAPGKSASHRPTGTSSDSANTTSGGAVAPVVPVLPTQAATGAGHKKSGRP